MILQHQTSSTSRCWRQLTKKLRGRKIESVRRSDFTNAHDSSTSNLIDIRQLTKKLRGRKIESVRRSDFTNAHDSSSTSNLIDIEIWNAFGRGVGGSSQKALKSLEGEKRSAIKKAKGTKGKKAKQAIAAVEEEYASRLRDMQQEHEQKLKSLGALIESPPNQKKEGVVASELDDTTKELSEKEKKQLKARKKKERQKEREIERQAALDSEIANAGPSLRDVELEQIEITLTPLDLCMKEVEADGHCLYRAIGAQMGTDYQEIRGICADALRDNEPEFSPFCELTDAVSSFDSYVSQVRNSAEWGGHLELRALSLALERPIHVFSVQSGTKPLEIDGGSGKGKEPLLLSYHLHYYALGEHYNLVVSR